MSKYLQENWSHWLLWKGFALQVTTYYNQTKPTLEWKEGANKWAKQFDCGGATNAIVDAA